MKKLGSLLILFFVLLTNSPAVYAKTFTVDEVQIKGWVQTNGDMVVNEIFTYTLDGKFKRLNRSFPQKHLHQIEEFEAYIVNNDEPVVGEMTHEMLTKAHVETDGLTKSTAIQAEDEKVSVFYTYIMKNAVTSFDHYSALNVTYFEKGKNHKEDLNNVLISYVLPDVVGEENVHGFLYNKSRGVSERYSDGIEFTFPSSEAKTQTETNLLFPSSIMKDQLKKSSAFTLEKAAEAENMRYETFIKKQQHSKTIAKYSILAAILTFAAAVFVFIWKRNWMIPFGSAKAVLQTDPVYLAFINHNGHYHLRHFIAGLLSLVEKGEAQMKTAPSAERFARQKSAPDQTLSFQCKASNKNLLPYEQKLVDWLFKKNRPGEEFHLHEIAGQGEHEKSKKKLYQRRYYEFEKKHDEWRKEVKGLMTEAGTFSGKLSVLIKFGLMIWMALWMALIFYADGQGTAMLAVIGIGIIVVIVSYIPIQRKNTLLIFYSVVLVYFTFQLSGSGLKSPAILLIIASIFLIVGVPSQIIASRSALYTKLSIQKFQAGLSKGMPAGLTAEEQQRWLTRALVLKKNKGKGIKLDAAVISSIPLAALLAREDDPIQFVEKTWEPLNLMSVHTGPYGSGGTSSSYTDVGGTGGGSDGGGGAGAD